MLDTWTIHNTLCWACGHYRAHGWYTLHWQCMAPTHSNQGYWHNPTTGHMRETEYTEMALNGEIWKWRQLCDASQQQRHAWKHRWNEHGQQNSYVDLEAPQNVYNCGRVTMQGVLQIDYILYFQEQLEVLKAWPSMHECWLCVWDGRRHIVSHHQKPLHLSVGR